MLESLKAAYQEIGQGIVGVLPEGWQAAYVLFEPLAGNAAGYAAYFRSPDGSFKYFRLPHHVYVRFMELWKRAAQETGAQWTSATFVVQSHGSFDVEYGYEPLREGEEADRRRAWKQRHAIT